VNVGKDKLVVVDTNCLVRMYFSPVRPLMGRAVAKYALMTLAQLAAELRSLATRQEHAWLSDPVILAEVDAAVLRLTRKQLATVDLHVPPLRKRAEKFLREHCVATNRRMIRNLSKVDETALVAAIALDAALATDEWPLRLFSGQVEADDNGNSVELLSSVELLHLVEKEGLTTRAERISTYRAWVQYGEFCEDASTVYRKLFKEQPPKANQ
jgi:rRNA-processing protein FCF1